LNTVRIGLVEDGDAAAIAVVEVQGRDDGEHYVVRHVERVPLESAVDRLEVIQAGARGPEECFVVAPSDAEHWVQHDDLHVIQLSGGRIALLLHRVVAAAESVRTLYARWVERADESDTGEIEIVRTREINPATSKPYSTSTVHKAIDWLNAHRLLERIRSWGGRGIGTTYRVYAEPVIVVYGDELAESFGDRFPDSINIPVKSLHTATKTDLVEGLGRVLRAHRLRSQLEVSQSSDLVDELKALQDKDGVVEYRPTPGKQDGLVMATAAAVWSDCGRMVFLSSEGGC